MLVLMINLKMLYGQMSAVFSWNDIAAVALEKKRPAKKAETKTKTKTLITGPLLGWHFMSRSNKDSYIHQEVV